MTTITTDRAPADRQARRPSRSRNRPRLDRTPWTCANCLRQTVPPRKRCGDCGTSRY
ncbi:MULTISPECIES: hypothetical protein [unclassified Geodermatophilus]|uniref:hypothetical protein n=1 Tax=unclassified Geodermatophilus TaxID=2637632 RepID=UPI003EEDAB65